MVDLVLYNTMSRRKEVFKPLNPPNVGMYCCGPTVYHYAHIGNLRAYVFEDVLKRVLLWHGFKVKHVVNITDVGHLTSDADEGEDKIEKGAKREGKSAWEIAEFYTRAFMDDLSRLNILEPSVWCKATEHIKEQLDMVLCLWRKGFAYKTSDGIYFDTSKLDDYGKLARLDKSKLLAGKRVALGEKRNPTDFALWKFSPRDKKREMEWDSPWGPSFPGWHIECSAMASHYLGKQFDIHCGGVDHIPVHHTNEIAQAEACFGVKPWVKYWLHNEFLVLEDSKMSKSSGEFLTLQSLVDAGFDPLAFRYFLLNTHYRKRVLFSFDALRSAQNAFDRLYRFVVDNKLVDESLLSGFDESFLSRFESAVSDDLNTPKALAVLWDLVRSDVDVNVKIATLFKFDSVLGFGMRDWSVDEVPEEVSKLLVKRDDARKSKNWVLADELRERIRSLGFEVVDSKQGSFVRRLKR